MKRSLSSFLRLPPPLVRVALAGHSALGLAVAALLFLVALSGTVVMFVPELDHLQEPQVPVIEQVDAALAQRALEAVPGGPAQWKRLSLKYPTPGAPRLVLTAWPQRGEARRFAVDAQGALTPLGEPWSAFVLDLHEHLTLPGMAGAIVVGILGVAMLALALGGVLAHPRLFRDAFTFRSQAGERVRQADLHNRLSVWPLPFHLTIAFTGAALALSVPVATLVGRLVYQLPPAAISAALLGPAAPKGSPAAAMPSLGPLLAQADAGASGIQRLIVGEPGTAGQIVRVDVDKTGRLVYGDRLFFDATGRALNPGGMLDRTPGLPFLNGLFALHFGTYGGTALRVLYGLSGLALCTVIASGPRLWLAKRRARGRGQGLPRLELLWAGLTWGSALALAVSFGATLSNVGSSVAPGLVFVGVWCLVLMGSQAFEQPLPLRRFLAGATAACMLGLAGAAMLR